MKNKTKKQVLKKSKITSKKFFKTKKKIEENKR